jgi:hypothetical protein
VRCATSRARPTPKAYAPTRASDRPSVWLKQFFHIKTAELYADKIEVRPDKKVKFADLVPAVSYSFTSASQKRVALSQYPHISKSHAQQHPAVLWRYEHGADQLQAFERFHGANEAIAI